uniref:Uncharacterized protein n=1 Tax=Sphaerodactylus townsendi TaxID=933632 RepID=A0ACB8EBZ6_9SAUR
MRKLVFSTVTQASEVTSEEHGEDWGSSSSVPPALLNCVQSVEAGLEGIQYVCIIQELLELIRHMTLPSMILVHMTPPCADYHAVETCRGRRVVEACLLHMLKRRAAGFLRTDKIAALFTKVGKTYDVADEICRKVQDLLQQVDGR